MSDLPLPEPTSVEVLDIQHDTDPAEQHGNARRIPHLGHAMLFFSIAWMSLALCVLGVFAAAHIHTDEAARAHPGLNLAGEALSYAVTLLLASQLFPRLWDRPFLRGLHWNALGARRRWYWIVLAGFALSGLAQTTLHFLPTPEKTPFDALLGTMHGAWLTAAFGILLAPLTEEIAFRGFLLPGLATAYDWLALDRTPAGLRQWESTTRHSTPALVFAAIFSSVPFALLHAPQVQHAWGVVAVLYCVSLALSYARVRFHSLAASVLLHASYNFTIFAVIFASTGAFRHLERLTQ